MSTKIEFRIDKNGKVHIDVEGVEGASCEDITRSFEVALGTTEETQRKPEYYVELDTLEQFQHEGEEE